MSEDTKKPNTEESDAVRKPVIIDEANAGTEASDGPRSPKNDRDFVEGSTDSTEEPETIRKLVVIGDQTEDDDGDRSPKNTDKKTTRDFKIEVTDEPTDKSKSS